MSKTTSPSGLSATLENIFYRLLDDLSTHKHQVVRLLDHARLPGWSRRSLFYFLGYIARADGPVTKADIRFAEGLIKTLDLSPRQRRHAIRHFQRGKAVDALPRLPGFRLRLIRGLRPRPALMVLFCLCHASQLHGSPSKARRYRCEDAVDRTGLPIDAMDIVLDSYARRSWAHQPELQPTPSTYDDACKLLGVSRQATLPEMKRAYRRRVSECHPDKLGRQLPESDYALAKERLHRYQLAWELIKSRDRVRNR